MLGPTDADLANTEAGVVISDELWRRRFHAEATVLGLRVRISDIGPDPEVFTIVGVAPKGFHGLATPWTPSQYWVATRQGGGYPVARLKAGTNLERFQHFVYVATATLKEMMRREGGQVINGSTLRYSGQEIDQLRFAVYRAVDVRSPSDPN